MATGGVMTAAGTARFVNEGAALDRLYVQIGEFLVAQRLEPDPANYAFAHAILADPGGPLARAVAAMTDGGIRLTLRDIETLGCEVSTTGAGAHARADGLVAQTQMQVDGFVDVVHDLRAETQGFGRDLAAGADAILRSREAADGASPAIDEVARIAAAMVERVMTAEARLEAATREAAELRAKLEEARDNARRDPLTELPNRRAFEEAFAQRTASGEALWLAVCDIDHFKDVNDRFGHAVGDRVLKAIGLALSDACHGHLVARYGGEEFVVLFSGIDAGRARATIEGARDAVAARRFKLRESDRPLGAITMSAGLAPICEDDSVRAAFQRADALLYKAKSEGRNCVRVG